MGLWTKLCHTALPLGIGYVRRSKRTESAASAVIVNRPIGVSVGLIPESTRYMVIQNSATNVAVADIDQRR